MIAVCRGRHPSILSTMYEVHADLCRKDQVKNVVTDPATGSIYLDTAVVTLDT